MDRVRALIEKLNEQLLQNADNTSLRLTAQQLLGELGGPMLMKPITQNIFIESSDESTEESTEESTQESSDESTEESTQPDVQSIFGSNIKEVIDHIILEPIKDLRAAIGINDKFLFIQELFAGDEKSFEVNIKTINAFKIFAEAQFYIKRELREKNNWNEESLLVKNFDQLVKRRFS